MNNSINLEWKKLNFSETKYKYNLWKCSRTYREKKILDNVSGKIQSGSLVAIMGSSGAGKTTLLAAISQRIKGDISGSILINDEPINRENMINFSCFVPQFDIVHNSLTAKEHLQFVANLKANQFLSKYEMNKKIELIIVKLKLRKFINNKINTLSGGEKKKLSLASELLTEPSIIFCDEPTTGLDSFSALSVIKTLRHLIDTEESDDGNIRCNSNKYITGENGYENKKCKNKDLNSMELGRIHPIKQMYFRKIIMCSIHQPTSDVFECFTHIILMNAGRIMFQGSVNCAYKYFSKLGYTCPISYNPAEYYVKLISVEQSKQFLENQSNDDKNNNCLEEVQSMQSYQKIHFDVFKYKSQKVSWFKQFSILSQREVLQTRRTIKEKLITKFISMVSAFTIAIVFSGINMKTQESVQDVQGAIFTIITELIFTSSYGIVFVLPLKMPMLRREIGENLYTLSAYYLSVFLLCIPNCFLDGFLFLGIVYVSIKFSRGIWLYLRMALALSVVCITSNSYGFMLSGMNESPNIIAESAPPIDLTFLILSGVYVSLNSYPYLRYISLFYFSNEMLSLIFWNDVDFIPCSPRFGGYCLRNGTEVLKKFSFQSDYSNIWFDYVGLLTLALIMNIIGFLGVRRFVKKAAYY